jgi:glycerol-3-phosphate dehydrogenase
MASIKRDPEKASKKTYDLIIIGGGVYGAMLALEAGRRNLHSLLIERSDFGEFTSFNSLRIIHGGFRYLQKLDVLRVIESVKERRWFLKKFPELVKPLPCLMPLYGKGLRHPFLLRSGLWLYDILSYYRNQKVCSEQHIASGRIITSEQTMEILPSLDKKGLKGGAIWHDAFVPDSQRLIMAVLRWACEYGATVLNYVEAIKLLRNEKSIIGITTIDHESGKYHEFKSKTVINATGPWCRELAECFDQDEPTLFRSMMAWNILFNRKALSDHAVAVTDKKQGGRAYFLVPFKDKLLAGTGHSQWMRNEKKPMPSEEQIKEFCDDLNLALPNLNINVNDIIHVLPGLQPARKTGGTEFATREVIFNHGNNGGPVGLFSISGVKFTTARLVAEKTLNIVFSKREVPKLAKNKIFMPPPDSQDRRGIFVIDNNPTNNIYSWQNELNSLVTEESVQHLDDLIIRRTNLWENPEWSLEVAANMCRLFDWDDSRCDKEISRLKSKLSR